MKHFTPEQWVDFVRGLVTGSEQIAMERHLASGCAECGATAGVFRKLAAAGRAEAEVEAPAELVKGALGLFARPRPKLSELLRVVPQLIQAAFREPLAAGVRGEEFPSQVLYNVLDLSVALQVKSERLEDERSRVRMVLVGQIADRVQAGKRRPDVLVSLVSGRCVAAHAVSNEWGEFHLLYEPGPRLRLQIMDGSRNIEIPLPRFSSMEGP